MDTDRVRRANDFEMAVLVRRIAKEARAAQLIGAASLGWDVSGANVLDLFCAIERAGDEMRSLDDRREPEAKRLFRARRALRAAVGA